MNGRSRRVARTLRCQSAVESPQRSSRPYLGARSFWKRNIKLTRKGIRKSSWFSGSRNIVGFGKTANGQNRRPVSGFCTGLWAPTRPTVLDVSQRLSQGHTRIPQVQWVVFCLL